MIDRLPNFQRDPKVMIIRKSLEVASAVGLGLAIAWSIKSHIESSNTQNAGADSANSTDTNPNSSFKKTAGTGENAVIVAPYPNLPDKPAFTVNYEQKTFVYEKQKIQGVKVAGFHIVGTKRIDKDNPAKETAQFDVIRYQVKNQTSPTFGIDLGDGVLRSIYRSTGLHHDRKTISLGVGYILKNDGDSFEDPKSLIEIELNQTPPSDPLLAGEILEDPNGKIRTTFDALNQITIYGQGNISVDLNKTYLEENPASSRALFNLAVFLLQNAK